MCVTIHNLVSHALSAGILSSEEKIRTRREERRREEEERERRREKREREEERERREERERERNKEKGEGRQSRRREREGGRRTEREKGKKGEGGRDSFTLNAIELFTTSRSCVLGEPNTTPFYGKGTCLQAAPSHQRRRGREREREKEGEDLLSYHGENAGSKGPSPQEAEEEVRTGKSELSAGL